MKEKLRRLALFVLGLVLIGVLSPAVKAEDICAITTVEQRGESFVYLAWEPWPGAEGYALYRSQGQGQPRHVKDISGCSTYNYGLENGKTYTYQIRPYATLPDGQRQYLAEGQEKTVQIGVNTPTDLTLKAAGKTSVTISWKGDPLADQYVLYRSTDGESWSLVKSVTTTQTTTYGLSQGQTYYFRVKAARKVGNVLRYSPYSEAGRITLGLGVPGWFSVTKVGKTSLNLGWEAVPGATGYRLYRAENGGAYTLVKTVTGTETGNYSLKPDSTYTYRIAAICEQDGQTTKGDYAYTEPIRLSLGEVTGLAVEKRYATGVRLRWTEVPGATGYRLYRQGEEGTATLVKTLTGTECDTYSLTQGQCYSFSVKAICESDRVTVNGPVSVPVSLYLAVPRLTLSGEGGNTFRASWEAVAGAEEYLLEIQQSGKVSQLTTAETEAELSFTGEDAATVTLWARRKDLLSQPAQETISPERPKTTYRAVLIGEENYETVLNGPLNDIAAMGNMLSGLKAMDWQVWQQPDASREELAQLIQQAFGQARESDVSLFYYSGHGVTNSGNHYAGALVTANYDYIPMQDLAELLSVVPGRVVVLLDSCGSGAAISTQGIDGAESSFDPAAFNAQVVGAFSQYAGNHNRAGELAGEKFFVLTASAYEQNARSLQIAGIWGGAFTRALVGSVGYDYNTGAWAKTIPGDTDGDGTLTLAECYRHCAGVTAAYQDVQVYPKNSSAGLFFR